MKIVIAPDAFKGGLTAKEVADNIEKGVLRVLPGAEVIKIPMADGGEGTVQSLVDATNGRIIEKEVVGPTGERVTAHFGLLGNGKIAVIEMARASGLPLVPAGQEDPSRTTTYGTGQLIKAALAENIEELIIGIGGSATNDAGVGMAQALGVSFTDKNGAEIGYGGRELSKIQNIYMDGLDQGIKNVKFYVACDVNNPLYGPDGAAYVYAPQKGADQEMVEFLDQNLRYFSHSVKKVLNKDVQDIPGAGAAGGLGAGLVAFLGAELRPGIDIVLEANKVKEKMRGADLVITGEGKMDGQTVKGKTPIGVARTAKEYHIPVIAINGSLGEGYQLVLNQGIDAVFSPLKEPVNLEEAIRSTATLLEEGTEQIIRTFILCGR